MTAEQLKTLEDVSRKVNHTDVIEWANNADIDYYGWTDLELYIAYGKAHLEDTNENT